MSDDRATAMTDALDVAQKLITLCRRRQIDIPRLEIEISTFANTDADLTIQWMEPENVYIPTIEEVFAVRFGAPIFQGSSSWMTAEGNVDGVHVKYVVFTT